MQNRNCSGTAICLLPGIHKEGVIMVRRESECAISYKEHMRDGKGTVQLTSFISGAAELNEKGRLFSKITLNPGCSIGFHIHEGESELFYFMKGSGIYSDNGELKNVTAGDVAICPAGTGHGIENNTEEVLEIAAVILYA